jgi:hypothetical protein
MTCLAGLLLGVLLVWVAAEGFIRELGSRRAHPHVWSLFA